MFFFLELRFLRISLNENPFLILSMVVVVMVCIFQQKQFTVFTFCNTCIIFNLYIVDFIVSGRVCHSCPGFK